jgi:hypothetical protein
MAVGLALAVLWGFGPTYFLRPFLHTRDISWVVHVHAFVYIGWISLFLVQATLVARDRTDLHRRLGAVGVVWGALVVVVGISTVPFFVALVAYDLVTTKRVHPATIAGGSVLFFFQFLASVLQ